MILHIPHSSTFTNGKEVQYKNILYFTDWFTDELFNHKQADKMVFNYSRFYCDVERLPNKDEPLYSEGHGILYTKDLFGNELFEKNPDKVIQEYKKWHRTLNILTGKSLSYFEKVVVVDCHSFPKDIAPNIDFCIGTVKQTDQRLVHSVYDFLKKDYNVKINEPYSYSIIPSEYVGNKNVQPIMIEVNKKLYLENNPGIVHNINAEYNEDIKVPLKSKRFEKTKQTIQEILDIIANYEVKKEL